MSRSPGNRNRFADDRLWDDSGREWNRITSNLSSAEVEVAIADKNIRLGVHDDFGRPMRWVEDSKKSSTWSDQIAHDFADSGLMSKRARKRGRLPYTASMWASGDDRLLIFESD